MAWILQCILLVSLASTHGSEIADARSMREGERAVNHKPNGSYKILNRFVKPFVNKRVDFDAFVFPEVSSKTGNEISSVIPDECKRLGICDDIPNYPEELVAHLIRKALQENGTKFNKDVLEVPQIAERIGPEEENIELCASSERLYAPRAAQDMNNEWHVILNDKQKPQQTFRVEICQQKNSPCSSIAYFQTGYQSMCIQKYMLRRMMALNEQKEVIERPFQVPSCCSCVARAV